MLMGDSKNSISQLSPPDRGVHACHCPGSSHRRVNNLPSCVPGILQIPAFTMPVSGPSAQPSVQHTCVLFQACSWFLRLQILGTWHSLDLVDPLEEGLPMLGAVLFCHRGSPYKRVLLLEFIVKHSKKPVSRLTTLSICIYAKKLGSATAPTSSPKCTPRRGTVSPSVAQGILRAHFPLLNPFLLHRSIFTPVGLHIGYRMEF